MSWDFLVNRLEIVDSTQDLEEGGGRSYVKWEDYDFEVTLSHQDEGRTLKIFLTKPLQEG